MRSASPSGRRSSTSWPGARTRSRGWSGWWTGIRSEGMADLAPSIVAVRQARAALGLSGRSQAVALSDTCETTCTTGRWNFLRALSTRSFLSQRERDARVRRDHDHVGGERRRGRPRSPPSAPCPRRGRGVEALRAQDPEHVVDSLLRVRDRTFLVPGAEAVVVRDCGREHEELRRAAILDPADLGEQLLRTYGLVRDYKHARHGVLRRRVVEPDDTRPRSGVATRPGRRRARRRRGRAPRSGRRPRTGSRRHPSR